MKEKILIFIIGLLLGAVIATGSFFVYSKATSCNNNTQQIEMNGGQPPSMPGGDNNQSNGGQPPAKPGDNNTQNSTQENNS